MAGESAAAPDLDYVRRVGQSFVSQYYQMLGKQTSELHKFYSEESRFNYSVVVASEEAKAGMVKGAEAIRDQHVSLNFENVKVNLEEGTFDFQSSQEGGVIILVTGSLQLKDAAKEQKFVQTFFLQKTARGAFFVLNNLLRILPGNPAPAKVEKAVAAETPAPAPKTKAKVKVAATKAKAAPKPKLNKKEKKDDEDAKPPEAETKGKASSGAKAKRANSKSPPPSQDAKENNAKVPGGGAGAPAAPADKGPKSWASIAATTPVLATNVSSNANAGEGGSEKPKGDGGAKGISAELPTDGDGKDAAASAPKKGKKSSKRGESKKEPKPAPSTAILSRSIFVKEVGSGVSKDELVDLFAPCGKVKDVEFFRDKKYAFVIFQAPSSVQKAIHAPQMTLNGKALKVEARNFRGSGGKSSTGRAQNSSRHGRNDRDSKQRGGRGRGSKEGKKN